MQTYGIRMGYCWRTTIEITGCVFNIFIPFNFKLLLNIFSLWWMFQIHNFLYFSNPALIPFMNVSPIFRLFWRLWLRVGQCCFWRSFPEFCAATLNSLLPLYNNITFLCVYEACICREREKWRTWHKINLER